MFLITCARGRAMASTWTLRPFPAAAARCPSPLT